MTHRPPNLTWALVLLGAVGVVTVGALALVALVRWLVEVL